MINTQFVFDTLDPITKQHVKAYAQSVYYKLYLQAVVKDCEKQLAELSANCTAEELHSQYSGIVKERDVYRDMLEFLSDLTTDEGNTP